MKGFGKKHPILMTVLVFMAGLVLALILAFPLTIIGMSGELSLGISRIAAGLLLAILFRYCFAKHRLFASFPYVLAAFLFGVWNLVYHPLIGNPAASVGLDAVILALAPAVFEEVIFRGIGVWFLKERGYSDPAVTGISGLFFRACASDQHRRHESSKRASADGLCRGGRAGICGSLCEER